MTIQQKLSNPNTLARLKAYKGRLQFRKHLVKHSSQKEFSILSDPRNPYHKFYKESFYYETSLGGAKWFCETSFQRNISSP